MSPTSVLQQPPLTGLPRKGSGEGGVGGVESRGRGCRTLVGDLCLLQVSYSSLLRQVCLERALVRGLGEGWRVVGGVVGHL